MEPFQIVIRFKILKNFGVSIFKIIKDTSFQQFTFEASESAKILPKPFSYYQTYCLRRLMRFAREKIIESAPAHCHHLTEKINGKPVFITFNKKVNLLYICRLKMDKAFDLLRVHRLQNVPLHFYLFEFGSEFFHFSRKNGSGFRSRFALSPPAMEQIFTHSESVGNFAHRLPVGNQSQQLLFEFGIVFTTLFSLGGA
jgi:hypothetical protein